MARIRRMPAAGGEPKSGSDAMQPRRPHSPAWTHAEPFSWEPTGKQTTQVHSAQGLEQPIRDPHNHNRPNEKHQRPFRVNEWALATAEGQGCERPRGDCTDKAALPNEVDGNVPGAEPD